MPLIIISKAVSHLGVNVCNGPLLHGVIDNEKNMKQKNSEHFFTELPTNGTRRSSCLSSSQFMELSNGLFGDLVKSLLLFFYPPLYFPPPGAPKIHLAVVATYVPRHWPSSPPGPDLSSRHRSPPRWPPPSPLCASPQGSSSSASSLTTAP